MKDENIALFKRFLKTEGCNTLYAGMYNQSHPKDAPDDVEMFLREVDAKDAILGAFVFPEGNSNFGVNYWFEKAVKWEKTLESATASQFYAYCYHNKESVSREAARPLNKVNTYLHTYSTEVTGIERALQTQSKETKKQSEPVKLDAWSSNRKTEEPVKQPDVPLQHSVTEEQMALSGFKLFSITKKSSERLKEDEVTINTKSGNRFCFNKKLSEEIKDARHEYIHIYSKENTIYMLFDDNEKDAIKWRINSCNVVFSSKQLVSNICEFFNIKEEQTTLHISKNMSKTSNNLFYKITKSK
ncbi:hypothetical protein SAMN04487851_11465 [Prevotella sp. tc2-28]|uniref:hypothetical protein n=1 Tax=Prevotella sp. tc2-28 TaxID=1761888 RepID=UPI0008969D92|nr:hypothetical protein [Prevotella sp. tc2-28]SEA79811.1 hypothetical protein SAMN04487851_11465 [Prevotella sp. tc2-28]